MDKRGLTPEAFKIPTSNDWDILQNFLGGVMPMSKTLANYKWTQIYKDTYIEHTGENTIGFNAKATGCILNTGVYNKGACSFGGQIQSINQIYPNHLNFIALGFVLSNIKKKISLILNLDLV